MAKQKVGAINKIYVPKKKKRGKSAKTKESSNKNSKNYKKPYRGQGRR